MKQGILKVSFNLKKNERKKENENDSNDFLSTFVCLAPNNDNPSVRK